MKLLLFCSIALHLGLASAFVAPQSSPSRESLAELQAEASTSRQDFLKQSFSLVGSTAVLLSSAPAQARGRATLEQSYERYAPRIKAGGEFYKSDLKKLVASGDFEGLKNALAEPPKRKKEDLSKPDSGVAERARQAGQFSDARVLVAADLFASAFSESSISPKTKKMQAAVAKVRNVVNEMQSICKQALGEESSGGLFGFGAKKVDKAALAGQIRSLYVEGGNAWNEYVLAANDELALQFDRFPFIS